MNGYFVKHQQGKQIKKSEAHTRTKTSNKLRYIQNLVYILNLFVRAILKLFWKFETKERRKYFI